MRKNLDVEIINGLFFRYDPNIKTCYNVNSIKELKNVVYCIKTNTNKEYIGSTTNLGTRLNTHAMKITTQCLERPYLNGLNGNFIFEIDILGQENNIHKLKQLEQNVIINRAKMVTEKYMDKNLTMEDFNANKHHYKLWWSKHVLNTIIG